MNRSAVIASLAFALRVPRLQPRESGPAHPDGGAFKSRGRCRDYTAADRRAFHNRVAKRRAKKGYAYNR